MSSLSVETLALWCSECLDFHPVRDCKVVESKGGIFYICPNTADEILMWQNPQGVAQ